MADKIDVAVIGLGGMGNTHLAAAFASPFAGRVYGYDPDPEKAEAARAKGPLIPVASPEEIWRNPAVRFVSIASPNNTHAELASAGLRAGKAVLCEKPMGETLAEARSMAAAAEKTGGFLQIGFELRYSRLYQTAKAWIDRGLIGRPVNSQCLYYCSEGHGKGCWRSQSPGTLIGEKLSHYLDLHRWFIGRPVESVFSLRAPKVVDYFNHPDNHQISLMFEGGAIASLNFVMYAGETDAADPRDPLLEILEKQSDDGHALQFRVFGDKGAIETDVFRRRVRRWEFSDAPRFLASKLAETVRYPREEDNEWIHNTHGQNRRLIEVAARGGRPENPVSDSLITMRAGFAAERSEAERRVVGMPEIDG